MPYLGVLSAFLFIATRSNRTIPCARLPFPKPDDTTATGT